MLIANSNLVGRWANWDDFRELERAGLMMYGQMTAGSWIYIGSQGILQGTYETFGAVARTHFGGTLAGRFVLTAGLGGMGGAQPLAATMNGAAILGIEVDESRIDKRLETGYCDRKTRSPRRSARRGSDEATAAKQRALGRTRRQRGRGAAGARAPRRDARRAHRSDERARHAEWLCARRAVARRRRRRSARAIPRSTSRRANASIVEHVRAMLAHAAARRGHVRLRQQHPHGGARQRRRTTRSTFPGFVPEYVRPLFCEGKGPFRWVALSGDPKDIARTDELVLELFPHDAHLRRWITLARERVHFQGLPARICWLGQGERARFGVALNDLVASGELSAPIVIGRDHLDTGSVASPFRETEAMKDGSDAIADWPILNALLNTASGASWVSFHHGGGVGIGNSLHAGQVIVADGTPEMRVRLERVLTNDPGIGVARHADAGYEHRASQHGDESDAGDSDLPDAATSMRDARRIARCSPRRFRAAGTSRSSSAKYAWLTARGAPVLVHFEVTLRCNARCGFCDYWKTDADGSARSELKSFADAARFFNPMLVTFTGGEPTLRRDLEDLVAEVDRAITLKYVTLITHGAHAHARARAVALGRGRQPVQHLARLPRRAARRGARHSRARRARSSPPFPRCARAASTTFASTPSSRTTTSTRSCRSSRVRRGSWASA